MHIDVKLTEDQVLTLVEVTEKRIKECTYYIERYEKQVGKQVLSHRQERSFLLRILEKLNTALVK